MKEIHLCADYGWWPVWKLDESESYKEDFDPHELPISSELADKLNDWADMYDDVYNADSPQESGFHSQEEALSFYRLGLELGERLQKELGFGYQVIIDPDLEWQKNHVRK